MAQSVELPKSEENLLINQFRCRKIFENYANKYFMRNYQIIVGDQLGMPEEAQYKITFADFRKKAREFNYHS